MQAVLATAVASVMALVLAWSPTTAEARSANTERIIGNIEIVLSSLTLVDAFATGPIPEKERQTATNLLRDIDYALRRATGDLARVPVEEQDAEVKALMKRVADLTAYREKVAKNLEASVKGGAELDKQYRAFRDDVKPFKTAISVFTIRPGSTQQYDNMTPVHLTVGLERLAKLDELCTTKYKGLEFNDRLGFQLGVDPTTDCSIAAKRVEIATTIVETGAANDIATRTKQIDGARTGLEGADGQIRGLTSTHDLVFDTAKGTAALQARHEPMFKAIGKTMPAGFLTPITTAVTALWAEVDRLAPTYEFPKKLAHDGPAEAAAKKEVARIFDGAKVMKSGMEFAQWSIAKNNLDIPTEQYRTGVVLTKGKADKWCVLRTFTAHKTYIGGGKYQQTMTFTFSGSRYQKCN